MLYIGSSGKFRIMDGKGAISTRKNGVRARVTRGKKNKTHRFNQWHYDMKKIGAKRLHIYSQQTAFVEEGKLEHTKIPLYAEAYLMQSYFEKYGLPPEWNLSF